MTKSSGKQSEEKRKVWWTKKNALKCGLFCVLMLVSGAHFEAATLYEMASKDGPPTAQFSIPFGVGIEMPKGWFSWYFIFKGFFFAGISIIFINKLYEVVGDEVDDYQSRLSSIKYNKEIADLLFMLNKSGIDRIHPVKRGIPNSSQGYADDVFDAVDRSKSLRILTIAGYEYIGRKKKSLLYDKLKRRNDMAMEFVLLDPRNGTSVIQQRVRELLGREQTYTDGDITEEINETLNTLQKFKQKRPDQASPIEIRTIQKHPLFRLLFTDDTLFLSTYEQDHHGHESPIYQIKKADGNTAEMSLYNSFLALFHRIRDEGTVLEPLPKGDE